MRFYECNLSYKSKESGKIIEVITNAPKKTWGDMLIQDMNETSRKKSAKTKLK